MRTRKALLAGLLVLACLPAAAPAATGSATFDADLLSPKASGRAIVGFTHDVDAATIARLAKAGIVKAVVIKTIDAAGVLGSLDSYRAIAKWSDVVYVDADSPVRFENFGAKKDTKVTQVRAGAKPLRKKYAGAGVTVAVVDTGVDSNHPDLTDRVVKSVNFEPSWFFDMINDGLYSDQLSEASGSALDSYGHGTHVAGIVAGTGASGMGEDFSGVAPGASIVNLKIADAWQGVDCTVPCDFGWEINALVAYEWLIENRNDPAFPGGIRIATNSWSIVEVDSEVEPISLIVSAAARKGIVNVFAAGNDGPEANTVALGPNRLEEVITVGAVCKTSGFVDTGSCAAGRIAGFSSRGPQVDVVAPGVDIYSTMAHPSIYAPIGGHQPPPGTSDPAGMVNNAAMYTSFDGTSMATPHVAGIVALMLQANPKLTPAQVEKILISTATDKGDRGFDTTYGFGLVNAHRAVVAGLAVPAKRTKR